MPHPLANFIAHLHISSNPKQTTGQCHGHLSHDFSRALKYAASPFPKAIKTINDKSIRKFAVREKVSQEQTTAHKKKIERAVR